MDYENLNEIAVVRLNPSLNDHYWLLFTASSDNQNKIYAQNLNDLNENPYTSEYQEFTVYGFTASPADDGSYYFYG
jgi:hypothetical protein